MKKCQPKKIDWIKGLVACALYIAFLVWIQSWWGVIVLPFIFDAYITKKINWGWWKDLEDPILRTVMSWVDAIVFALVAVYFVNIYFFQNYTIPSSSLEKSLLVGDYLFVSKMSYGPRVPQTPLHAPLCQHTLPLGLGKSYIESVQWDYKRVTPKQVTLNDIVVFNYPAGDTIAYNWQNTDYYRMCKELYMYNMDVPANLDSMSALEQYRFYNYAIRTGSDYVKSVPAQFGKVAWRPVDRRENYVKRCVGTPGDTLQIIDNVVHIDGVAEPKHPYLQYNYIVRTDGHILGNSYLSKLGISKEDRETNGNGIYRLPLTVDMKAELAKNSHVLSIEIEQEEQGGEVYPLGHNSWTRDNYGPIYVPAKGDTIMITEENFWVYKRIADAYEFKPMKVGEPYVFEMDYYWMMGDNRHKSADSRYWGFVPEDHIVGRPMFVWLSIEKDNAWGKGHIRWNRIGLSNFE